MVEIDQDLGAMIEISDPVPVPPVIEEGGDITHAPGQDLQKLCPLLSTIVLDPKVHLLATRGATDLKVHHENIIQVDQEVLQENHRRHHHYHRGVVVAVVENLVLAPSLLYMCQLQ